MIAGSMVMAVGLDLGGLNPIRSLFYSAILNGLTAPPLIIVMWLLARNPAVLGHRASGRVSSTLMVATAIGIAALPIAYLLCS